MTQTSYVPRFLEKKLRQYVQQFPVTLLTGARQAGKSTLLKHLFPGESWEYLTLDQRGILHQIQSDPDLFVKNISSNIIIDEAQKCPELFHAIKWRVDEGLKHKIILSGSANFQLMSRVTETLAGRAGVLELFPFSVNEVNRGRNGLENILDGKFKALDKKSDEQMLESMLWGGFPKIFEYRKPEEKKNWFENYRTTYIERDLRDLTQVADLNDFQRFFEKAAFQIGGILNLSNIANDIGITVPTCKKYLHILETSYQFFLLKPYHANISKRLVKSPKLYAWDTGLANYFLGIDSEKYLKSSSFYGSVFENFMITELLKQNSFLSRKAHLYFWRTSSGDEVDVIVDYKNQLIPVEIKSGVQISDGSIAGLLKFMDLKLPQKIPYGIVFYRGDRIMQIRPRIWAVPVTFI